MQQLSVNGKSAGSLTGIRAPSNNNPVQDVSSNNMICGQPGSTSKTVIDVAAGDKLGAYWQHLIGGPQGPNDHDNPIAKSHKGPIMAYLAKVDNAATASASGLKWFKISEDGFDTGNRQWGVDRMMPTGWSYFNMPKCIAPGQYLLRMEIIALHSAKTRGAAQFYQSCVQINVSGSGTFSPGSQTVSFPGAYKADDPGILVNIYGLTGTPDNAGKPYKAPGPAPISC